MDRSFDRNSEQGAKLRGVTRWDVVLRTTNAPESLVPSVRDVVAQRRAGTSALRGVMIESNLLGGRQDSDGGGLKALERGRSITDGCLDFEGTADLLRELAGG